MNGTLQKLYDYAEFAEATPSEETPRLLAWCVKLLCHELNHHIGIEDEKSDKDVADRDLQCARYQKLLCSLGILSDEDVL